MTFQMMALVMTCAGCLLGGRFIFAGGSVLKEWGVEPTPGAIIVFPPGSARCISPSP